MYKCNKVWYTIVFKDVNNVREGFITIVYISRSYDGQSCLSHGDAALLQM